MEHIGEIEKRLWSVADTLRANSGFTSNDYFLPVMGLIFLRHAHSRFLKVRAEVEPTLPSRGGKRRDLTKEDFSRRGAIFLRPEAQFGRLVALPDGADRARAIIGAMEKIEEDYETLRGALPKAEYQKLDNAVLGDILRTFDDPALQHADGDVFGRVYEYFLTQFADQKAHDGGEFFTPVSLVQTIVNVIEPDHGTVLDPACGSGGMFVQSAHFIERLHSHAAEQVTFRGLEKIPATIGLAKLNLAVHGLEGDIRSANTYYEDPHELHRKCDFVMANPPFNVDEVDAEKVKNDPRLPFGLPGVNKKGRVSNGNYLWISYFDSYLNAKGRAGFVMSSQASSAGGAEGKVRRKLVEAGHVDVMMAIRSGFFYTRSVPCELWFLDRDKPAERQGKVLMIDARNVCRKVTRKIWDFTPEQQKNLSAVVWLHRGQADRFVALVAEHLERMIETASEAAEPLGRYAKALAAAAELEAEEETPADLRDAIEKLATERTAFAAAADGFVALTEAMCAAWQAADQNNAALRDFAGRAAPIADAGRDLIRQADHLYRLSSRIADETRKTKKAKTAGSKLRRVLDDLRKELVEHLERPRHFLRQARWLQERFPDAALRDVEGLVKLVDREELAENDWSLTPGRYVGVAPEEDDEDFDFGETMREIHAELGALNEEAAALAEKIAGNFEELGA